MDVATHVNFWVILEVCSGVLNTEKFWALKDYENHDIMRSQTDSWTQLGIGISAFPVLFVATTLLNFHSSSRNDSPWNCEITEAALQIISSCSEALGHHWGRFACRYPSRYYR